MTDRLSLRAWLAGLLVISAALFFLGIYLERRVTSPAPPVAVQPSPSGHAEGAGGEAGEAGHSEAPVASAGEAGETPAQHAAESWPFGIDLEAPLLVGGAIIVSLLLALAVIRTTAPIVLVAVVGFAVLFAVLDLVEVSHQLGVSRTGLAAIAIILLALHALAMAIAVRLLTTRSSNLVGQ